jgi:hypothetical protein
MTMLKEKQIAVRVPMNVILEARHAALDQNTTLKALVNEGLMHVLAQRKARVGADLAETTTK